MRFLEHEAQSVTIKLMSALGYIHEVGIIHRDLKPENILIKLNDTQDEISEVKLIDFGFSKIMKPKELLYSGCGTPNYVAPEVLQGIGYDKRSDIFSLGVVLYFM